jgi:DHA1 family multidrug resistance protein-like MFS transporter
MSAPLAASTGDRRARRLVVALTTAAFLEWAGATAIVPLLPLFLRHRGASDALIGVVMGAFFVAGVVTQYPLGKLSDRIGRRPVLVFGLVCYAAASVAFAAPVSPVVYAVLRAVQGVGAGATLVVAAATLSESLPPGRRGRGFGALFGGQTAGMAVGPLLGSLAGPDAMTPVFIGAGLAALAACGPVIAEVPRRPLATRPAADHARLRLRQLVTSRIVLGVMVATASIGVLTGTYEVCWGLLMSSRGATSWQIGLSWTLWSIPFVAVSVPAGKLADRLDRRWLTALALLASAGFAASYPFLPTVSLLIGLGAIDGLAVAVSYPAPLSMLADGVEPDELGRAQGVVSTAETAAVAVFASISGALFAISAWVAFITAAVVIAAAVAVLAVIWAPVQGRVTATAVGRAPANAIEAEAVSASTRRH